MEAVNQLTDLTLFGFLLVSIALGWGFGYTKGVINGYKHAKSEDLEEYPITNVYFYETDIEDKFSFVNMVTGELITVGSFDDCIECVQSKNLDKKVVFAKGDQNEQ